MRIAHVFLMTTCATLAAGCNSTAKDAPLAPTPVRVAVATHGPAAPSIRTNGVLANRDEIRLAFKVGGVIKRLAAVEGELVRKGQKLAEIEQTVFVERDSQRKIVLGKGGQTIKAIGQAARREIAEIAEAQVHLFLFVKVRENWSDDPERYREMGLEFPRGG